MKRNRNDRGQGLIEYLILVAVIAVGTISVVRIVGKNVSVQFANVARVLGGNDQKLKAEDINSSDYEKKDFSNFMNGAVSSHDK